MTTAAIPVTSCIGPALVTAIEDGTVRCLLGDQVVTVAPAMPMQYRAEPGDVLLVAGDGQRHWAIGVIQGRGACSLSTEGDLELRSTAGRVRIEAARGIDLDSPRTRLRGARIELIADSLLTQAIDWLAQVRDRLQLRARRRDTAIAETDVTTTGSTSHRSTGNVVIDGKQIHLG